MSRFIPILAVLLFIHCASAATYYVDFDNGADANEGTTKGTPWKRVKGMANVAGTAAATGLAAGDEVNFRGGISWKACFPFVLPNSGSSGNPIFYKVDPTWTTNGETRAIFDFENINLGQYSGGAGFNISSRSHIAFVDLDLRNFRGTLNVPDGASFGNVNIYTENSGNLFFTNCVIKNWDLPSNPAAGQDGAGGVTANANIDLLYFYRCELHQSNVTRRCGFAFHQVGGYFLSNEVHHVGGAFNGAGYFARNHIYDVVAHTDPDKHGDVIYDPFAGSYVYENIIHDISCGACIQMGNFVGMTTCYIYNNVVWNTTPAAVSIFTSTESKSAFVCNNTLQAVTGIFVSDHGGSTASLQAQNNIFIDATYPMLLNGLNGSGTVLALQNSHNLTNTTAEVAAYGASIANRFKVTVAGSTNIDAGTNLVSFITTDVEGIIRPINLFDVGAYEYGTSAARTTRGGFVQSGGRISR